MKCNVSVVIEISSLSFTINSLLQTLSRRLVLIISFLTSKSLISSTINKDVESTRNLTASSDSTILLFLYTKPSTMAWRLITKETFTSPIKPKTSSGKWIMRPYSRSSPDRHYLTRSRWWLTRTQAFAISV